MGSLCTAISSNQFARSPLDQILKKRGVPLQPEKHEEAFTNRGCIPEKKLHQTYSVAHYISLFSSAERVLFAPLKIKWVFHSNQRSTRRRFMSRARWKPYWRCWACFDRTRCFSDKPWRRSFPSANRTVSTCFFAGVRVAR